MHAGRCKFSISHSFQNTEGYYRVLPKVSDSVYGVGMIISKFKHVVQRALGISRALRASAVFSLHSIPFSDGMWAEVLNVPESSEGLTPLIPPLLRNNRQ